MIEVQGVSMTYRQGREAIPALLDISFSVTAGRIVALLGPSGCGKTTLLYLMAGLLRPTAGQIRIAGEAVQRGRRGTAVILQDYGLLPWKTVRENAALGLEVRGEPWDEADRALQDLGLWDLRRRYPHQVSGGQRQRVAIARALATFPDLLLMDEPFSSLDALTREDLQNLLLDVWRRRRTTIVIVTHSIEEAAYLGQEILVMTHRPGQVSGVVRSPGAGRTDYRREAAFLQTCILLRELLGQGKGAMADGG